MKLLVTLAALSALASACSSECATNGDCKANEACTDNACVPKPITPPPMRSDGGGFRDAAAPDAETLTDAAPAPDALGVGDPDASAGLAHDAGPITDGGARDSGAQPDGGMGPAFVGLIEVAAIQTPTGHQSSQSGSFFRHAEAPRLDVFGAGSGSCLLIDRVGPRDRAQGFGGTEIFISGFAASIVTQMVLFEAMPGLFENESPRPNQLVFPGAPQGDLTYNISDNRRPGDLGILSDSLASLPSEGGPSLLMPSSNASPLSLGVASIDFTWSPMAGSTLFVVAEVYDAQRSLVLRCITDDSSGALTIPLVAVQEFLARSPTAPFGVDLVYEIKKTVTVPINGSTDVLDTTLRHIAGTRFTATQ